jgi:hypothetical protein
VLRSKIIAFTCMLQATACSEDVRSSLLGALNKAEAAAGRCWCCVRTTGSQTPRFVTCAPLLLVHGHNCTISFSIAGQQFVASNCMGWA